MRYFDGMVDQTQPMIIRADASTQIGIGHLMRCLALAKAWQDSGGMIVFVIAMGVPRIEARLQSEGMEVVHLSVQPGSNDDAIQTADLARRRKASWVVVDGYHFGADYQRIIKDSGLYLLAIDSGYSRHYYARIVLNQNIHADEGLYENRELYTQLLIGTRYILLRPEFLEWRGWKREIPGVARKVLVTLGGGDPDNVTLKVILALQQVEVKGLEAVVVVGGSNPHYEKLLSAIKDLQYSIRLVRDAINMPALMAWADVAVSAGGGTCWEMALMGLPNLIIVVADNQRVAAEGLHEKGAAVSLGWREQVSGREIARSLESLMGDAVKRAGMARTGRSLVDGRGAERVLMAMGEVHEIGQNW